MHFTFIYHLKLQYELLFFKAVSYTSYFLTYILKTLHIKVDTSPFEKITMQPI